MWFCLFRTEKKSTIINLRLSLNSILWLWRRICMKKILNQAKQISPKWLNSPVKEQRPDSFKGFFPVLLKLPLEGFNFDKKNPQKRQFFFFCFLQRTITLSVMMLSGSIYKQLWYLHHCFYNNLMRYWLRELSRQAVFLIKPSTATRSRCQAQAAESTVGTGLLKGKNKGSHLPLMTLAFPSPCLHRLGLCRLLVYSTATACMYLNSQIRLWKPWHI